VFFLALVAVTSELLARFCGEWTRVLPILPFHRPRAAAENNEREEYERQHPYYGLTLMVAAHPDAAPSRVEGS
jgi:hypothetical protein